jgi:hypothetical protein
MPWFYEGERPHRRTFRDEDSDPIELAYRLLKREKKLERRATEAEKEKHKDKISRPKNKWEKVDVFHMFLGMLLFSLFIGPYLGLVYLNMLTNYAKALQPLAH